MNSSTADVLAQNGSEVSMAQVPAKDVQVHVTGLNKIFYGRRGKSVHVLKDINLEIAKGELLVLLGPSGCGKTTLLRCLVGLEQPTMGRVDLGKQTVVDAERGVYVSPNDRDVSMVFQNYALWPHMKVSQNVAYPLKARKKRKELESGRVEEVLKIVQCDHLADRYPPELSGGQQQRVSLARALAPNPTLLLLDEPLSNLDALLRIELRAQLRHLHRTLRFTGVYVTHDQEEALALASRVVVMKAGEIEQIGRPDDVYGRPATEYVADFLGFRNKFPLTASGRDATISGQTFAGLAGSALTPGEYSLRVRASETRLRKQGELVAGNVRWLTGAKLIEVLPGMNSTEYVVELDGKDFFIDLPKGSTLRPGDDVEIGIDLDASHCFTQAGPRVDDWATI
jgi:iron(III) transport system ATP-binding protein